MHMHPTASEDCAAENDKKIDTRAGPGLPVCIYMYMLYIYISYMYALGVPSYDTCAT